MARRWVALATMALLSLPAYANTDGIMVALDDPNPPTAINFGSCVFSEKNTCQLEVLYQWTDKSEYQKLQTHAFDLQQCQVFCDSKCADVVVAHVVPHNLSLPTCPAARISR